MYVVLLLTGPTGEIHGKSADSYLQLHEKGVLQTWNEESEELKLISFRRGVKRVILLQ